MSDPVNLNLNQVQEAQQRAANEVALQEKLQAPQEFKAFLQQAQGTSSLKFSAHAQARMQSRNIRLSQQDLNSLSEAVDKASAKGANETVVVMKDKAFVVSPKNRVVITAVDKDSMTENVFTNIDSAVIVK